jgi:hypothetical protein
MTKISYNSTMYSTVLHHIHDYIITTLYHVYDSIIPCLRDYTITFSTLIRQESVLDEATIDVNEFCRLGQLDCGNQSTNCPLVCDCMRAQFHLRVAGSLKFLIGRYIPGIWLVYDIDTCILNLV